MGYLKRSPVPFRHNLEHSFVSNIKKIRFFNHLYVVTAAQVLVLQQEVQIWLRMYAVSCILT